MFKALLAACAVIFGAWANAHGAEEAALSPSRIAVLPTISDVGTSAGWRPWTKSFAAALQAELLEGWEAVVVSRAGLSAVVFDQKLAISKGLRDTPPQIQAADHLVFVVLDSRNKQLRVHVMANGEEMRDVGEPVIHRFNHARHFGNAMPAVVAKDVAARIGLKKRKPGEANAAPREQERDADSDDSTAMRMAIIPPYSALDQNNTASGMIPVFTALLEDACLAAGPNTGLVEREEIRRLLAERELAAIGAITSEIDANAASDIARLAGARFILVPYLFPLEAQQARVTIHVVDSRSGQIVAARSWAQRLDHEPPAGHLRALLAQAARRPPPGKFSETPAQTGLRHAEARFLRGLRRTLESLRADFRERIEINLTLADAAIALSHDDPLMLSGTLQDFLNSISWYGSLSLEYDDHARLQAYKQAMADGSLAEIHRQVRRVFELPLREMAERRGAPMDFIRMARFHLLTGNPEETIEILLREPDGIEDIYRGKDSVLLYARALVEAGRLREAAGFLKEDDRRHIMQDSAYFLLLDVHRANGDTQDEINLMYRDHRKRLKDFNTSQLARFLEIAPHHRRPDFCLIGFNRLAHGWYRSEARVIEQLVRLRIALGQKERAIEDAQCGHLMSLLSDNKQLARIFAALLDELGARPLESLPVPAGHARFAAGARIDLVHDITIPADRARNIATLLAGFWGCEVHLIAAPLDVSKLSCFDAASRRVHGERLVASLHPLIREDDRLLQTIVLTALPMRVDNGAIFSSTSYYGAIHLTSTYYSDYFHRDDEKPPHGIKLAGRDEKVVMAMQSGVIKNAINRHLWQQTKPGERFMPLPPDPLSSSGSLHLTDRLFGVSPFTLRLLGEMEPEAFSRTAHESRTKLMERVANDESADITAVRKIAGLLSGTDPVVVQPER